MLRLCEISDIEQVLTLEQDSFPPDEAATFDSLMLRITEAPKFFYKLVDHENSSEVIGFVNGTCIRGSVIYHDSMTSHIQGGETLVIHSVTITERKRRSGLGIRMLSEYINSIRLSTNVRRILLLSKAYLLVMLCNRSLLVSHLITNVQLITL